jgi:hypothetical protein
MESSITTSNTYDSTHITRTTGNGHIAARFTKVRNAIGRWVGQNDSTFAVSIPTRVGINGQVFCTPAPGTVVSVTNGVINGVFFPGKVLARKAVMGDLYNESVIYVSSYLSSGGHGEPIPSSIGGAA